MCFDFGVLVQESVHRQESVHSWMTPCVSCKSSTQSGWPWESDWLAGEFDTEERLAIVIMSLFDLLEDRDGRE